ncbi:hypothetical protein IE53DRAFT_388938 [Violaceomyces palustris]|uniref:Uncharacterized protein n=1 Tax=Violaceomyces palustris TaxID=1673888 RepID=A0ACD0NSP4_9BASI|nr:hypothetical protein IE53DRAFT_388938 [Violaceomyces palustris]
MTRAQARLIQQITGYNQVLEVPDEPAQKRRRRHQSDPRSPPYPSFPSSARIDSKDDQEESLSPQLGLVAVRACREGSPEVTTPPPPDHTEITTPPLLPTPTLDQPDEDLSQLSSKSEDKLPAKSQKETTSSCLNAHMPGRDGRDQKEQGLAEKEASQAMQQRRDKLRTNHSIHLDSSQSSSCRTDCTPSQKEEEEEARVEFKEEEALLMQEQQSVQSGSSQDVSLNPSGRPSRRAALRSLEAMRETQVALEVKEPSVASKKPAHARSAVPKRSQRELIASKQFVHEGKLMELQISNCQSKRYSTWVKCMQCYAKVGGDSCRFVGIRAFFVDPRTGNPHDYDEEHPNADLAPVLMSSKNPEPKMEFPKDKDFNRPMDHFCRDRIMRTVAESLMPTMELEIEHARMAKCLRRDRELQYRQMCDFCMTSIFSASWMCRICGKELCVECKDVLSTKPGGFLSNCVRFRQHTIEDFVPTTRFFLDTLVEEVKLMKTLVNSSEDHPKQQEVNDKSDSSEDDEGQLSDVHSSSTDEPQDWAKIRPVDAGSIADRIVGSHTLKRFRSETLSADEFMAEWSKGEPLLVESVTPAMQNEWGPKAFIDRYGEDECFIVRCDKEPVVSKLKTQLDSITKRTTVGSFFRAFGKTEEERKEILGQGIWKLKDWPPSDSFDNVFPELYQDFNRAVPMADYTRRDGVINISSLYPGGVIKPDLGPKMYNAFPSVEAPGGKGSTRLHMDMADAVNIMLYAAPPQVDGLPEEHKPGVAAWDIFRAEDADKLRQFLRTELNLRYKDDPIHTHKHFIDSEMRIKLFKKYGVKSWRIYQKAGEAVFIPAGCAHQVCNLGDCIKVAVDFVSPENVSRCFKLTSEFRSMTQDSRAWKQDVLALKNTLWYAWCACREMQGAGPNANRPDNTFQVVMVKQPQPPIPNTSSASVRGKRHR